MKDNEKQTAEMRSVIDPGQAEFELDDMDKIKGLILNTMWLKQNAGFIRLDFKDTERSIVVTFTKQQYKLRYRLLPDFHNHTMRRLVEFMPLDERDYLLLFDDCAPMNFRPVWDLLVWLRDEKIKTVEQARKMDAVDHIIRGYAD